MCRMLGSPCPRAPGLGAQAAWEPGQHRCCSWGRALPRPGAKEEALPSRTPPQELPLQPWRNSSPPPEHRESPPPTPPEHMDDRNPSPNSGAHGRNHRPRQHMDDILGDFEDPQQPQCPQHTDAEGGSWLDGRPDHFENAPHNDLQQRQDRLRAGLWPCLSGSVGPGSPVRSSSQISQHEAGASHGAPAASGSHRRCLSFPRHTRKTQDTERVWPAGFLANLKDSLCVPPLWFITAR